MRKIIGVSCLILSMFFVVGCSNNKVYGNKESEILNYLEEWEALNVVDRSNISIIDTIYAENTKIIGFSTERSQGIIVYEKDKSGNYIFNESRFTEIDSRLGVSNYRVAYKDYGDLKNAKYAHVIISNGENVGSVEITINDKYKHFKELDREKPSVTLIEEELFDYENKEMKIDIKYYDKKGDNLEMD